MERNTQSNLLIRTATQEDLNDICRIEQLCFSAEAFTRRVLTHLVTRAQGVTYVAEVEGAVGGYIALLKRRGSRNIRIYSIAILPDHQGKGIASKLVAKAISFALAQDRTTITLEVRTDNSSAIALYEKFGFQRATLLRNYYHPTIDGWRMSLAVNK